VNLLFWRRRDTNDFAEAIRPELQSLPTPEPRKELLERILASREAGARIILPKVASQPARPRVMLLAAAAIAAVLLLVVIPRAPSTDGSPDETWASPAFFGTAAFAQTTSDAPELPPVTLERANALRPLVARFVRSVRDSSGNLTIELRRDVAIVPAVINGEPAWRITLLDRDANTPSQHNHAETLYVARSQLRMLQRAVHVSPYRRFQRINIQQHFLGDSITGRMTTDGPSIGPGREIARKLNPVFGPYLSDAFTSFFLMAAPLDRDWRGSASLLGWAVIPNDVFVPLAMRVEGEERISVPAGTFDCWRIAIRLGVRRISYWARKSDGLGVRTYEESEASTKGTRELVLWSIK